MRRAFISIVFIFISTAFHYEDAANEWLRQIVTNSIKEGSVIRIDNEPLHNTLFIQDFYYSRDFDLAWKSNIQVQSLLQEVKSAFHEGLTPEDYHESLIGFYQTKDKLKPLEKANLDLLLSDAFLTYATHILSGKVDPVEGIACWEANAELDLDSLLNYALENGSVRKILNSLEPDFTAYQYLKNSLAWYRSLESRGEWNEIPEGAVLKTGMADSRIPLIRNRLNASRDLQLDNGSEFFDEDLEIALKIFQRRNGLPVDGMMGINTLAVLNTPVKKRIEEIKVNLERIRWLPYRIANHYVLINIPAFTLDVFRKNLHVLEMKTVVGRSDRPTPTLNSKITYMVINPSWTVPSTILTEDILPILQKDTTYLSKHHMKIIQRKGEEKIVPPAAINWNQIDEDNFPYSLRQSPGPSNAMGSVKFMLPNSTNVYLHDTNQKNLFEETERAFSSGCIRISKPLELAELLLEDDHTWDRTSLEKAFYGKETISIVLTEPFKIYVVYWTAFVDENRLLNFRKDIYHQDSIILNALNMSPALNQ